MSLNKESKRIICIFDIDGTLTHSGVQITDEMFNVLNKLKSKNIELVAVGGGKYEIIKWQLRDSNLFDKIFAECGSIYYENNKLIEEKNIMDHCNRHILNEIIRSALFNISKLNILFSGNQIDVRKGLVYISPVGMQAIEYERNIFIELEKKEHIRKFLIEEFKKIDINDEFEIVLGGSVGIAVYPKGWNKAQIMKYFDINNNEIYFFGDRVDIDGNDYPLYSYPGIKGFGVKSYHKTITKLIKLFDIQN
jgi:phosphomannomutase